MFGGAAPLHAAMELRPKVGFDFEYFGETYRVTDDRDTVATINDYGTIAGLVFRTAARAPSFLALEGEIYYGKESERARCAVRAELLRGPNVFLLEQDALWTRFRDDGDYSVSSDSFRDTARLAWERRLGDRTILRVQDWFDFVQYADPDEYNLNSRVHRPGVVLRRKLAPGSEARAAYHFAVRDVPDSSALDSLRHTGELAAAFFFRDSFVFDASSVVERRLYDSGSSRESSWEARLDLDADWVRPGLLSWRVRQGTELVRFDEADDLDYDFTRLRLAGGPLVRVRPELTVGIAPVWGSLASSSAPAEDFTELALEIGVDWRIGPVWLSITEEFGRRDYEMETTGEFTDVILDDAGGDDSTQVALYSDSVYNRLTILANAEITKSMSIRFFSNWEPEDHKVDFDDADSRIVSGGIEYRF
jgi:hypothetical protein